MVVKTIESAAKLLLPALGAYQSSQCPGFLNCKMGMVRMIMIVILTLYGDCECQLI